MAGAERGDGADRPRARRRVLGARAERRRAPSSRSRPRADELELVVSASETHNQKNVRRSVAESLIGARDVVEIGHGAGHRRSRRSCRPRSAARTKATSRPSGSRSSPVTSSTRAPTGSRSATPPAWPRPAASTICSTRSTGPASRADRVGLHFHDTRGTALANVVAALERGVTRFDASIGGLGGCPYAPGASGNAVTEDLVHMLDDMEIETGIDLDALIDVRAARAGDRRPRAAERAAARRPPDAAVRVVSDADEFERLAEHAERALQGNLAKERRQARRAEQAVRARPARAAARRRLVRRGRAARQRARRRSSGRRRGHRRRPHRRPAGVRDGERLHGEGGLVGRAHGREDRAAHRARAAPRAAGRVPRRLRRRAHHRSGRAVPRPARRGPDLRQPGAAVGQGAAGVLPVRPVGRGRRVHPRVLRRGVHGRGQRLDVPRLAAHGRGRDRRARVARRDGRRAHARDRQRLRRQSLHVRRGRDRRGPPLPLVPADDLARAAPAATAASRRSPTREPIARRSCPTRGAARLRHAQGDRRARRRRFVLRAEAAVGAGAHHRLRPARRRGRSASSRTTRCISAECCSSTRPTRRRASSGCATRSTCRSCSSPTCPAS